MDFELNDVEKALVSSVDDMLHKHAGADRLRTVMNGSGYDDDLDKRLDEAGMYSLATDADAGPVATVLVQERVAAGLGAVSFGPRALIAPMLGLDLAGPIALASQLSGQRVRFAAQAQSALVLADSSAFVATIDKVSEESRAFGYPVATVELSKKDDLGPDAAADLLRWWRISLAADIAGAARTALLLTRNHLTDRIQFGKPIATKQAVQHRLATIYVRVEAATWLARYAASLTDPVEAREAAASAATTAVGLAHDAIWELHQLTGATGFTVEYDLQLMTMRMHALRLELGGVSGSHARDLANMRWFDGQATGRHASGKHSSVQRSSVS